MKKVIVIGAGASGMVAAIECARRGLETVILEAEEKPGKKLYATGNGKCNMTNINMSADCYYGGDREFIEKTVENFGYGDTIKYFNDLGLMSKDRNGYVYPMSGQASSVVKTLTDRCSCLGVKIRCSTPVTEIQEEGGAYLVHTDGYVYRADGVIVSCGSAAGVASGKCRAAGGYELAEKLGHKNVPLVSALTGLRCSDRKFFKAAKGVRCDGRISLYIDNKLLKSEVGELQLTDYGLSGIPVFQLSRLAGYGLFEKKAVKCTVDFCPYAESEELIEFINALRVKKSSQEICSCLTGIINENLAVAVLGRANVPGTKKMGAADGYDVKNIADNIKNFQDDITGINDFSKAQVLAGGVSLDEITCHMESKLHRNLYITGEMLDADGICGGYNLQWAWATGYIAGNHIFT